MILKLYRKLIIKAFLAFGMAFVLGEPAYAISFDIKPIKIFLMPIQE